MDKKIWHDETLIVGTIQSLIDLRNAINFAIEKGQGKSEHMTTDHEDYHLHVCLLEDETKWEDLHWPYNDSLAEAEDLREEEAED